MNQPENLATKKPDATAKAGGEAVWDLVARYLKAQKVVRPRDLNLPTLKGMAGKPGMP